MVHYVRLVPDKFQNDSINSFSGRCDNKLLKKIDRLSFITSSNLHGIVQNLVER